MTDLENLEETFTEMGIRYEVKSRFKIVDRSTWPYKEERIPGSRIRIDSSCFPMEKGLLEFWNGYSDFYFYFDFDENGTFEKCGAFE